MITYLIQAITKAVLYVKNHPQILFALMLLIVIPLLFLYTGQQFLDVGKSNQDRLQKDRIGLMEDTLSSLLFATNFDMGLAQSEMDRIAHLNPDIKDYKILKKDGSTIVPLVARNHEALGVPEKNVEVYRSASVNVDESIIFESVNDDGRIWDAYRAIEGKDGVAYFVYIEVSLAAEDSLFKSREQSAYVSLIFVYFFLIALAYWHIRLTDYRYLYIKTQKESEVKDLFTNMIAHELRAPLTAIRGYAMLLEDKMADPEQKKYASRVKDSSERLITIVTDLLDVARIQSGKLKVDMAETDVSSIVEAVVEELMVSAKEKNISLLHEGTSTNNAVISDAKRLQQALTNLVSNAIKYTEKGTITLSVEDKHAFVEIRVKDTGMGITAEDQKKLFAPFFRVQSADVNKITGTGLGMWITKELIGLIGAEIGVESIKGIGTHIVVTIPKAIRIS